MLIKNINKERDLFVSHNFDTSVIGMEDLLGNWLNSLENWCILFNNFCVAFFGYMKFIFVFIALSIGVLILLNLKNSSFQARLRCFRDNNIESKAGKIDNWDKVRLFIGLFYVFVSFGILFDFFTYFLIWVLDPIPDRLIFSFVSFSGSIDPQHLNRTTDFNAAEYPHEVTIYFCTALASGGAFIELMVSIWYLIAKKMEKLKIDIPLLIGGVVMGFLTGFTTCLPFFL
jgi:hypothetical protein